MNAARSSPCIAERDGVMLIQEHHGVSVVRPWRRRHHPYILVLGVVGIVAATALNLTLPYAGIRATFIPLYFIGLVGVVYGLYGLANRTTVTITESSIRVGRGPLPFTGHDRNHSRPTSIRVEYFNNYRAYLTWATYGETWIVEATLRGGQKVVLDLVWSRPIAEAMSALLDEALSMMPPQS